MKTGLILEGGACRGVFTAGVLDIMMAQGLTFDYCIGVSAGAGNAMNFKSGQQERVFHLTAENDPKNYCGITQVRKTGSFLDLHLLYHTLSYDGSIPFHFSDYYHNPMECEYVATCCETGEPEYLHEEVYQRRLQDIVMASSSMPGFCPPVEVDGKHYLDGGVSDPLPVDRAIEKGCDRMVLVTTKPADKIHPTNYGKIRPILAKLYKEQYPELFNLLMHRKERYFQKLDRAYHLEEEGKLFILRPCQCDMGAIEKDREKMQAYYRHGREVAELDWDAMTAYLKG